MAAPLVAAAALIVRQYFEEGFYPSGARDNGAGFSPSGALVKVSRSEADASAKVQREKDLTREKH